MRQREAGQRISFNPQPKAQAVSRWIIQPKTACAFGCGLNDESLKTPGYRRRRVLTRSPAMPISSITSVDGSGTGISR